MRAIYILRKGKWGRQFLERVPGRPLWRCWIRDTNKSVAGLYLGYYEMCVHRKYAYEKNQTWFRYTYAYEPPRPVFCSEKLSWELRFTLESCCFQSGRSSPSATLETEKTSCRIVHLGPPFFRCGKRVASILNKSRGASLDTIFNHDFWGWPNACLVINIQRA